MNVIHIIANLGHHSGGPSRSVPDLVKGLRDYGVQAEILTNNYTNNPNTIKADWIHTIERDRPGWHEINLDFKAQCSDYLKSFNGICHIHCVYNYPSSIAAYLCRQYRIPYIIAPRGSLYKSAIDVHNGIAKRIFNRLFLIKDLNHASVVHATCIEEMEAMRQLGVTSPIAIIPNSLPLAKERPAISLHDDLKVCFLGRVSSKKNINALIKAWHEAELHIHPKAELLIIGAAHTDIDKQYLQQLQRLTQQLGITNIVWTGGVYKDEKDKLLKSCSYLVLPSLSENFGMVVPEALQYGIPVIASRGTPWQSLEENHCGWWVEPNVESIARCLRQLPSISQEARQAMGLRGQQLVYKQFSTPIVSEMVTRMYQWILHKGSKPDYIDTCNQKPIIGGG